MDNFLDNLEKTQKMKDALYDQIKWERDIAIGQLESYGVGLGENAEMKRVVRGQWKYYHKKNIAVCTNCSFERDLDANFGRAICCPNCGAKMD